MSIDSHVAGRDAGIAWIFFAMFLTFLLALENHEKFTEGLGGSPIMD